MIRRLLACLSLSFVLGTALPALCANPPQSQPVSRITEPINDSLRVVLQGSVHPLAQPQNDKGAVMPSMPMGRMLLVLKRSPAQDKALAAAIKEMARPGSKTFHQWMTAEQIGTQFGVSQADVNKVTAWLAGSGFNVTSVSKARGEIGFSGSAQQVSSAFHTEIHSYLWKGKTYTANAKNPEIPVALAPVVAGFVALNNFPIKGAHTDSKVVTLDKTTKTWSVVPDKGATQTVENSTGQNLTARPDLTTKMAAGNTIYAVTPYDLATIYNLTPLWNEGLDGTGQQIAIVAESDIQISDVTEFRKAFGLPATHVNVIDNGPPAGLQADSDQQEAEIDVEWAGAIAKNATIDLVSTASTPLTTGLYLSMTYAVDNAVAPVLEVSYDYCEFTMGAAGNLFMYQTWQQAAAEGITVVVASGDTGSADCDNYIPLDGTNGMGVSAFASTPYDVAVGGTDFYADLTDPSAYWSKTNDPTTQASALSYIPEIPWNAACASPEVFTAFGAGSGASTPLQWCDSYTIPATFLAAEGGGGGPSTCSTFNLADFPNPSYCAAGYAKPDWQAGVNGIPTDGVRDLPDVSLFSSDLTFNTAYLYCLTDPVYVPSCNFTNTGELTYEVAGGTSFSAPAFAGMVALVNQKTNSTQGLANYYLYSMAAQEFGSTASPNNSQTLSCNSGSNQGGSNTCTFYDVTVGNIQQPCTVGTPECNPGPNYLAGITPGYSANPGYDLATGLGSVNATNLVNNWAALTAVTQPTLVTLSASSLSSSYGQPVKLSGTVTPLSGSGTPPGSVAIEGLISGAQVNQASIPVVNGAYSEAIQNLLPGSYAVTANYAGDGGYQSSASQPVSMVVAAATATSSIAFTSQDNRSLGTIPSTNGQIPYGNNVVTTVTVSSPVVATVANGVLVPTGSVTFSSNGKTIANVPLTGNFAVYTTTSDQPLGTYTLTAAYSGDQNYNSAGPVTQSYAVVQDGTSIEAHANAAIVEPGTPVTLSATVVSNSHFAEPTGSVTFSLNGVAVGTVAATPNQDPITLTGFDTATLLVPASKVPAGNNVVEATYSGDTKFQKSKSVPSTFVSVNPAQGSAQMTITSSATTATNLTAVTIQAVLTLNGAPVTQGTVNFLDNGKSIGQVQVVGLNPSAGLKSGTATLVKRLPVGTHEIVGLYSGVGNLIHPTGNGLPPITVTGEQITNTILSETSDVGTPANYDVTASVVAGGLTAPTGTLTLEEPSLSVPLNNSVLTPGNDVVGLTPSTSGAGSKNSAIVVGDFNGDGIQDYAAASTSLPTQLMVYLGNGDGTFKPGIGSVATYDPTVLPFTTMATADFNGDGILDIVFGNQNSNTFGGTDVVMMLGNGDGTFKQGQPLSVPAVSGGLTSIMGNIITGDFNNDGIPDIAFSNYGLENDASVEVFFGVGDGTFTNTPTVLANVGSASATYSTIYLATSDANKDGNADLVAFDSQDATATVFFGNGDGTFKTGTVYQAGNFPELGALGDLNGDGWPDMVIPNLVASSGTGSYVSVFLNNGDGTFGYPQTYVSHFPNQIVLADLNNDGILDIVQAEDNGGHVAVMYGSANGSYSFSQFTQTTINTAGAWAVALIDSKNSGYPDILVDEEGGSEVGVLLNGMVSTTQFNNVALVGSAADTETMSVNYSGDNANLPSSAPSLMLSGSNTTIATKLAWSPGANSTVFGTVVPSSVLNAQVANSIPGTITYVAQSNTGDIIPVSSATILPAAGAYSITATFTPTSTDDYAQSTASTVFNVTKAAVTTTLTSSATQAEAGASITLTDTLLSNTTGTPTGSVSFLAGSLSLGSATIGSTGIATITTTSLPAGTLSIMAIYTGDNNFNSAAATPISVATGSPSITLAVGQPSMTITVGASGTEALTVTPQLGYTGDVSFTCGSLPTGVTCSFSPSIGALSGAPLQSALTVTTADPSTSTAQNKSGAEMMAAGAAASLASILLFWLPDRRKRINWAVLLLIAGVAAFSIGCSGGGAPTTPVTGPASTNLVLASSATKFPDGGTVTFTATLAGTSGASATGSVAFLDGATQIGKADLTNGTAQLTVNSLTVGIHTITANYAGDTLNLPSTATGVQQAVTGQTFFTVIAASGNVSQSSVVSLTLQ